MTWADGLMNLIARLDAAGIHYRLDSFRKGAIAVEIAVPGERWEVEFLDDGTVDIERFRSDGSIHGEAALEELFKEFANRP